LGKLSELLNSRKLVLLDSAMGTELDKRGLSTQIPLWSSKALIDDPDSIRQIHIDNIDAGAEIITTNTFRTQRRIFKKANYKLKEFGFGETAFELTKEAVEIAQEAVLVTNENVLVAGCIAPLEDCYEPNLEIDESIYSSEHYEHIKNLFESGVDCFLAETMNSIKEIQCVLEQIKKFDKEYMISLSCINEEKLLSGEKLGDAIAEIEKHSPSAILVNCIHPSKAEPILSAMKSMTDKPLGCYANVGDEKLFDEGKFEIDINAEQYFSFAKKWKQLGVKIIGGCCGTSPEYIHKLASLKS